MPHTLVKRVPPVQERGRVTLSPLPRRLHFDGVSRRRIQWQLSGKSSYSAQSRRLPPGASHPAECRASVLQHLILLPRKTHKPHNVLSPSREPSPTSTPAGHNCSHAALWRLCGAAARSRGAPRSIRPTGLGRPCSSVVGWGHLTPVPGLPRRHRRPDESVWRVDDQGVFSPGDFAILFVAQLSHACVMAITWAGVEGESDELLLADSTDVFRTVTRAYRYWVPE